MNELRHVEYIEGAVGRACPTPANPPSYSELSSKRSAIPKILFLAADSRSHIHGALVAHVKDWKRGFEARKGDVEKAYVEGGEYGAKVVLDIAEESHSIQDVCDKAGRSANFKPYFNVRKVEFAKRIKGVVHEVFHFSGHCSEKYGLSLQQEPGLRQVSETSVSKDELIKEFATKPVHLAFFATCNSSAFAQTLVDRGLAEIAIGTENSVEDPEVVRFVAEFYDRLFGLGYGADRQTRIRNVQSAYAHALRFVSPAKCQMCIYPELVEQVKSGKLKNALTPPSQPMKNNVPAAHVQNEYT